MIRILHVDDSLDDRLLVRKRLTRLAPDLEFTEIDSAHTALSALKNGNFDCILSDFQMPQMNGLELLREIRSRSLDIPFIFLTGQGNEATAVEALRAGADDYFTKLEGFAHYDHLLHSIRKLVHVAGEISLKAEAVDALRESEHKFRQLFERSLDALLLLDGDTFVDCNPATLEILRCQNRNEVLNTHPEELSPPFQADGRDSKEKARELIHTAYKQGAHRFEWLHRRMDGDVFPVEVTLTKVPLGGKDILYVAWRDVTGRKKVEDELRASDRSYREIFNAGADAIFIHDAETGEVVDVNERACEMFGYSRDEVLNRTVGDISLGASPYSEQEAVSWIRKAAREGPQIFEWKSRRRNGEIFWTEVSLKSADIGGITRIIGLVRDIGERMRVQQQLQLTQFTVDHAADAVYWIDEKGRIFYANEEACRTTGYTREELLALKLWDIDPDYPRSNCQTTFDSQHASDDLITIQSQHVAKDGRLFPVEVHGKFLEYGGKKYLCAFAREISSRLRSEQMLRERDQQFTDTNNLLQTVLDSIPVRIFWKDRDSRFLGANRLMAMDAGLVNVQDMIGKSDDDMPWHSQADRYRADDRSVIESGVEILGIEESLTNPDGQTIWLRNNKVPLRDSQGKTIGILGTYEEITEPRRIARELEAFRGGFQVAAERTGQLLYDYDVHSGRIIWSGAILSVTGFLPEEFAEIDIHAWEGLIHPDDRSKAMLLLEHARANVGEFLCEYRMRRRDGTWAEVEESGVYLPDDSGTATRMFGIIKDVSSRKLAEQEALARTVDLDRYFESSLDLLCITDFESRFCRLNPQWEKTLGYPVKSLIGKKFLDFIHPDDVAATVACVQQLARNEEIHNFVNRYRAIDGAYHWIEWRSFPSEGRIYAVARDITQRIQTEEDLRRSQEQYLLLFNSNPHPMWVYDLETLKFLAVNDIAVETYGYSREEFLTMTLVDIRPAEEIPALFENVETHTEKIQRSRVWKHKIKRGQLIDVEIISHAIEFNGRQARLVLANNITERLKAEQALEVSETKYRTLFEILPIGITISDGSGGIVESNTVAEKLLGLTIEEQTQRKIDGKDWRIIRTDGSILPPEEFASTRALKEKRLIENMEMGIVREPNDTIWINVSARPIPLEGYGVAIVYSDITENKRSEEALRASEERFRTLIADVDKISIQGYRADGTVQFWNSASERVYGYTAQEAIGKNLLDLIIPEELREFVAAEVRRMIETSIPSPPGELILKHKDGSPVPVYSSHAIVRSGNGEPELFCIDVDISDRQRAQESLRQSEERYAITAKSTGQLLFDQELSTGKIVWAGAIEKLTGYSEEEFQTFDNDAWEQMIHPDDRELVKETFEKIKRAEGAVAINYRFQRKDGSYIHVEDESSYVYNDKGKPYRVIGSMKDISDRIITEAALRQSEEKYRFLAENVKDVLWSMTRELRLDYIGSSVKKLTGYEVDEYLALAPEEIFTESSLVKVAGIMQQHMIDNDNGLLTPQTAKDHTIELEFHYKDGTTGWGEVIYSVRFDMDGRINGFYGVTREINDRKRAEALILDQHEQLRAANEELDSFAHSVSHDLQAPLRRITSLVELIETTDTEGLSADSRRYLTLISNNSVDLRDLVKSLLEFSRAKRCDMTRMDVDLAEIAERIIAELQRDEPDRTAEIIVHKPLTIQADPSLMAVALQNLLSNAWKFTGRTGLTRIEFGRLTKEGEELYFVRDNGAGFDPARAKNLFQPFTRLHEASEFKGRGIGLSTTARIITRHGGRIWAESRPGEGATFFFTVPLVSEYNMETR